MKPAADQSVALGRTRATRLPTSTGGSRDNLTFEIGEHGPVGAEADNMVAQNFSDQPSVGITARQLDVLAFIKRFIAARGVSPSLVEIVAGAHLSSQSQAHYIVTALAERGRIRRNGDPSWVGRAIVVLDPAPDVAPSLNDEPLIFVPFHAGGVARA